MPSFRFDRDLSIAGRVFVRDAASGKVTSRLVRIDKPVLFVPNLCIHLTTERDTKWEYNREDQLRPVLATEAAEKLNSVKSDDEGAAVDGVNLRKDHHSSLLRLVADAAKCAIDDLVDFELCLYDTQPAVSIRTL